MTTPLRRENDDASLFSMLRSKATATAKRLRPAFAFVFFLSFLFVNGGQVILKYGIDQIRQVHYQICLCRRSNLELRLIESPLAESYGDSRDSFMEAIVGLLFNKT